MELPPSTISRARQESLPTPNLLYWSNDYKGCQEAEKTHWRETVLVGNLDGTLQLRATHFPMSCIPHLESIDTPTDEVGRSDEILTYDSAEILYDLIASNGEIGVAISVLGYSAYKYTDKNNGSTTYLIDHPSSKTLNRRLDKIRELTGYAPTVQEFNGDLFSRYDMRDAWNSNSILVSNEPKNYGHDSLFHLPMQLILPSRAVNLTSNRIKSVIDKAENSTDINPNNKEERAVRGLIGNLELAFNMYSLRNLNRALNEDDRDCKKIIIGELTGILFDDELSREQCYELAENVYSALLTRIKTLARLVDRI